jgi:flagellar motor switch protein FliM
MADILSQEEIDALLTGINEDDGEKETNESNSETPAEEVTGGRIVTPYDFKHPQRVNKDQLRTLENLHDNFARLLSQTFSGAMRAVVDVETAFVDQTTYSEFILGLSNPSCSYQFTLGPTNGRAVIDFAMPVVFAFVDRVFGGKGSSQGVDARLLTQIEINVINKILKRTLDDLEATWDNVLPVEISDIELETNPEFMQITAAQETVILLAFEVNSTNASGLLSLCYPFFTLESILPKLSQQTYVRSTRMNLEELEKGNRYRLEKTQMEVRAEIARGMASFRNLKDLEVGDVLTMDTRLSEPAVIYVKDEPKFIARPGCVGRQNAVQITEQIDPRDEIVYKNLSKPIVID